MFLYKTIYLFEQGKEGPPVTFVLGRVVFSSSPADKWKSLLRAERGVTTGATVASINKIPALKIDPELPFALLEHHPFNLHQDWCQHNQGCRSALLQISFRVLIDLSLIELS